MQNANEIVFNGKIITHGEPKADSPHIGSYLERAQEQAVAGAARNQRELQAAKVAQARTLQKEERAQAEFLRRATKRR